MARRRVALLLLALLPLRLRAATPASELWRVPLGKNATSAGRSIATPLGTTVVSDDLLTIYNIASASTSATQSTWTVRALNARDGSLNWSYSAAPQPIDPRVSIQLFLSRLSSDDPIVIAFHHSEVTGTATATSLDALTGIAAWTRSFVVPYLFDESAFASSGLPQLTGGNLLLQTGPAAVSMLSKDDGSSLGPQAEVSAYSGSLTFFTEGTTPFVNPILRTYLVALYTNATSGLQTASTWYIAGAIASSRPSVSVAISTPSSVVIATAIEDLYPTPRLQIIRFDSSMNEVSLLRYALYPSGAILSTTPLSSAYRDATSITHVGYDPAGGGNGARSLVFRTDAGGGTTLSLVLSLSGEAWTWAMPSTPLVPPIKLDFSSTTHAYFGSSCAPLNPVPTCTSGGVLYSVEIATGAVSRTDLGVAAAVPLGHYGDDFPVTGRLTVALSVASFARVVNGANGVSSVTGVYDGAAVWTFAPSGRSSQFLSFAGQDGALRATQGLARDPGTSVGLFIESASDADAGAYLVAAALSYASDSRSSKVNAGAIVGGVLGALAAVGVGVAVYFKGSELRAALGCGKSSAHSGVEASRLLT